MEKYVVGFFGIVWGPSRGGMGAGVRTFSEGHGKTMECCSDNIGDGLIII
jgi:hypothetical protein